MSTKTEAGNGGQGHHHGAIEVKVRLGDKYAVIVSQPSDTLGSIKERGLAALELKPEHASDYVLRFEGHDITDESQTLIHLLKEQPPHQVEFHLAHVSTYFVNGETETTVERELAVGVILEHAGFTPSSNYTLKSENPPEDFDSDYGHVVKIHQKQRFQALFKGPTPTS